MESPAHCLDSTIPTEEPRRYAYLLSSRPDPFVAALGCMKHSFAKGNSLLLEELLEYEMASVFTQVPVSTSACMCLGLQVFHGQTLLSYSLTQTSKSLMLHDDAAFKM